MRLSDIPAPILAQIEEFIDKNWGKLQVMSKYSNDTLQGEIERRWGYKLSPAQISRLHHKKVRLGNVYIPLDHARELERAYGSVSVGVKKAVARAVAEIPHLPEPYNRAYEFLRGGEYTMDELISRLRDMGYSNPQAVLREFSRAGVMMWEKDKIKVLNKRRLTDLEMLGFLGG